MLSRKTHFPQVPIEIAKKIAEEENGPRINEETPEQLRANGKPSAQVKPEDENKEVLQIGTGVERD